ncbi:hypothetical protein [Desulfotignum balticum]|uniref:hypothetical protein n=1 Tax=Desulfotignum balticum TaxID=115781 RepID=UPI00046258D0|nr:hypothetical protein [Desulfotignum balticum]
MKRFIIVILCCLILSGCVTREQKFANKLKTLHGTDATMLFDKMGYPTDTITAPNGNNVYIYNKSGSSIGTTPVFNYNTNLWEYHAVSRPRSCTIFFEVNQSGKIVNTQAKGNLCK